MKIKSLSIIFCLLCISTSIYAQTNIESKKLGKTLDKNTDKDAVFTSEIDLRKMKIAEDGCITIPSMPNNKFILVSGIDTTYIKERISYANQPKFKVTIETSDLEKLIYKLTVIEGIETVDEYKARYISEQKAKSRANLTVNPIQIIIQETNHLGESETVWLPSAVQDKLKLNLQSYLHMKTMIDAKSDENIINQRFLEEDYFYGQDKIHSVAEFTKAKYALLTKIIKSQTGYGLSIDLMDLITNEHIVVYDSKDYSKAEDLYDYYGAIDEITLKLSEALELPLGENEKAHLETGYYGNTIDERLAFSKENEGNIKRMMSEHSSDISKLAGKKDSSSVESKKKLQAEKKIFKDQSKAETKKQNVLVTQKHFETADSSLEDDRPAATKKTRDSFAADIDKKTAELKKAKKSKQSVFREINIIESKKKALVEIRRKNEAKFKEFHKQMVAEQNSEEDRISKMEWRPEDMEKGKPSKHAKLDREIQILDRKDELLNKFFDDCEAYKVSTKARQRQLLKEIRNDQQAITPMRRISSMAGDELQISFKTYDSVKNGWTASYRFYIDGIFIYSDTIFISYETMTGELIPESEDYNNSSILNHFADVVDIYNSLLVNDKAVLYFELDYNVVAEEDDKPSQYKFNFKNIDCIDTSTGRLVYSKELKKSVSKKMKRTWDLREFAGIFERTYVQRYGNYRRIEYDMVNKNMSRKEVEIQIAQEIEKRGFDMVSVPEYDFQMLRSELPQKYYSWLMKYNPSNTVGAEYPVEKVSWNDAIYFCNKLSEKYGLQPVYSVNGTSDISKWGYKPHSGDELENVSQNINADGFRLPLVEEWAIMAKAGEDTKYSGSGDIDDVAWYVDNSGGKPHKIESKKPNAYGFYDMTGNVWEWCWDSSDDYRCYCGGSYRTKENLCEISGTRSNIPFNKFSDIGFRLVRTVSWY